MAYRNGPLSSEFSGYMKDLEKRKKTARKGKLSRDNLYVRSRTQDPDDYDNRNALQKRKESMVPGRVQEAARQGSGRSGYYDRENEAAIGATKQEFKENSGKVTMNWMQREANEKKYRDEWEKNQQEQELHEKNRQKLADQRFGGRVVSQARRNLSDNISSTRTPALSRARYIQENGLDREDAKLSRKELNRNIGVTETKNLVKSKGKPIVNYAIQEAERRTKQRNKK